MLTRNQLVGLLHKGAAEATGSRDKEVYADWLAERTKDWFPPDGARSSTLLSSLQVDLLVRQLKAEGFLGMKREGRSAGPDAPTPKQWALLRQLVERRGWEGLEDGRFVEWMKHTAKVSHRRFLTRTKVSHLITGLDRWLRGMPEVPE